MTHASWLETLWLMIASAGHLAAMVNFFEARYDWLRFHDSSVPEQRFLTRAIYQGSRVILFKHTVSVMAALWAITHAPPPPLYGDELLWGTQLFGTTLGWAIVSCGMTAQAIMGIKWRRQLSTGDYDGTHLLPPKDGRRKTDDMIPRAGIDAFRQPPKDDDCS